MYFFCSNQLNLSNQGPQGCLEKQNYPLSSNLVVWCTKIGPKIKKVRKTWEMTRKTSKNDGFLILFRSFLVLDPILAHQTTKFELRWFCFSRRPWGPWGRLSSRVIYISKIFQLFFGCWRHLPKKFVFFKLKPDVPFIILHA